MRIVAFLLAIGVCLYHPCPIFGQAKPLGLRIPPGFQITEYAGSELANDIYMLAIDTKGRVTVSGRGYIRILSDDNKDGKADRASQFAGSPKDGAMGMHWEGDSLYVTGDGGLRRFRDKNGDDRADGPSELIHRMRTGGEHHAHAIRRGPDGWLYVLCGNHTGIDKTFAQLPTSPVKEPVAGCVVRFTPDLKKSEIVAHGFRNAYGMDFNPDGELFTYDSDNERCVALPWYEYTRFYHVIPGGFYGWLSPQRAQWWRCPPYYLDVVAPVTDLERGSPTGVACYRHVQFPKKYRGGMFACDWTFGRIWFLKLIPAGSTYTCEKEVFIQSVGDNGFAPTGIAVHPKTGDMFVAVGGRGTRGAVYRVRYKGAGKVDPKKVAALQPKKRELPWPYRPVNKWTAPRDWKPASLSQLRAYIALRRFQDRFGYNQFSTRHPVTLYDTDKYVRQMAAIILRSESNPRPKLQALDLKLSPNKKLGRYPETAGLAYYQTQPKLVAQIAAKRIAGTATPQSRLESVRVLQLALGELGSQQSRTTIWEGYTLRKKAKELVKTFGKKLLSTILSNLRQAFPSRHPDLDRELSRMLASLEDNDSRTRDKVMGLLTKADHPVEQIHYLTVLARLRSERTLSVTKATVESLLSLERNLEKRKLHTDRHWPLRVSELYSELARKDPKLNDAMLSHRIFGQPGHAVFAMTPGFDKKRAAEKFLARAKSEDEFGWTPQLVQLIGALPKEKVVPVARKLWGSSGLESSILPILARNPQIQDQPKFAAGLNSAEKRVVELCLRALQRLPRKTTDQEILDLLLAFNRFPKKQSKKLRLQIANYLQQKTGQKHGLNHEAWLKWFSTKNPALARRLTNPDGVDISAWKKRLAKLDWSSGSLAKGRAVFAKAKCINCHSGRVALGPDLHGVTQRFSRDDLMTAMLQPSKDIPVRYQSTLISTAAGKLYQGLVIYQAADSVILQTRETETVRIAGKEVAGQYRVSTSLMPSGLLDPLSDREIADLYAYLRSLRK